MRMRKKTNSKILIQINQNNQYIVMFVCLITFIPIERVSMYVLHELIVSIDTKNVAAASHKINVHLMRACFKLLFFFLLLGRKRMGNPTLLSILSDFFSCTK